MEKKTILAKEKASTIDSIHRPVLHLPDNDNCPYLRALVSVYPDFRIQIQPSPAIGPRCDVGTKAKNAEIHHKII